MDLWVSKAPCCLIKFHFLSGGYERLVPAAAWGEAAEGEEAAPPFCGFGGLMHCRGRGGGAGVCEPPPTPALAGVRPSRAKPRSGSILLQRRPLCLARRKWICPAIGLADAKIHGSWTRRAAGGSEIMADSPSPTPRLRMKLRGGGCTGPQPGPANGRGGASAQVLWSRHCASQVYASLGYMRVGLD